MLQANIVCVCVCVCFSLKALVYVKWYVCVCVLYVHIMSDTANTHHHTNSTPATAILTPLLKWSDHSAPDASSMHVVIRSIDFIQW